MLKIFSNMFFFYMHDIQIMTGEISLLIRKLLKNTLLYPFMEHTKTKKLLLIELKIKHNALILRDHIIQFFTWWYWRCNIPFNSTYKKVIFVPFVLMTGWQEPPMIIIKDVLSSFVKVKTLLFSIQYGHTNFSCML